MTQQVSPLRRRLIDEMTIRNMSPNTQKAYVCAAQNLSRHFMKSPDKLTFENVREYQFHLVSRGLQTATIVPRSCAASDSFTRQLSGVRTLQSIFRSAARRTPCPSS